MRYVFQYPEMRGTSTDMLDAGDVATLAIAAEAAGWDGFSFTEHPAPGARWLAAGGHQSLDPFIALAHVAAVTSRLRLLTYLTVVPYRNPLLLAKSAATVDKLSKGRLTLGVGTGYLKSEFYAVGADFAERNQVFDEAMEVLPKHWSGDPFSYTGLHFDARDIQGRPRPVQDPIPIWIGGNSQLTLRRVAGWAQGWMPLTAPPQVVSTARTASLASAQDLASRIRQMKDMAGRRGSRIDVAVAYSDALVWGARDGDHGAAVAALEEVGVTWLVVSCPAASEGASLEFISSFPELVGGFGGGAEN
ncbi:MAG: LLM class F420-dependent oxidoreductase [Acidimicrobiales bacterium]